MCLSICRVGNFRQKNNSAEEGTAGTNGYFRRNSGYSAEQKISEFRSEPFRGRENNLGIPFRGAKKEVNSHNSFPNPSAEENTTRNSVPWNQIDANFRNSIPNHSAEEKTSRNSFPCNKKKKYTLGMPFRTIPWKRTNSKRYF
jgi:hypothetical protein